MARTPNTLRLFVLIALLLLGGSFIMKWPAGDGVADATEKPFTSATYRYRLTVEVNTPEGLKSGSSVVEVRVARAGRPPGPTQLYTDVRGEAVAVDLPNGQTLFSLLRSKDSSDWAAGVLEGAAAPLLPEEMMKLKDPYAETMRRTLALSGPQVVRRWWPAIYGGSNTPLVDGYPMLVRFRDIKDPNTVEKVDPDNLTASFGSGYAISRITAERTGEHVTIGIEKKLPWLETVYARLRKDFLPEGIPLGDFQGLFSTKVTP